jgi:hypothetical protein
VQQAPGTLPATLETPDVPMICASDHSFDLRLSLISVAMGVKYYTHFLMNDRPETTNEFSGVVELNRTPRAAQDLEDIAAILARSLDLDSDDIRVLHWSRLH